RCRRRAAVGAPVRGTVIGGRAVVAAALRGAGEGGADAGQGEDEEDDRHHEGEVRELRQLLIDHCALPSGESSVAREGQSSGIAAVPARPPSCACESVVARDRTSPSDRKSTRLNSSHVKISYAVFCLKKK